MILAEGERPRASHNKLSQERLISHKGASFGSERRNFLIFWLFSVTSREDIEYGSCSFFFKPKADSKSAAMMTCHFVKSFRLTA